MNFVLADSLKLLGILCLTLLLGACGGSKNGTAGSTLPGANINSAVDINPVVPAPVDPTLAPTTGAATLNWLPPTENADSSTLEDLAGYKIYYGTSPDSFPNVISISNPGLSSFVIDNLPSNITYYFTITALNSRGIESRFSNIVSKEIQG